MEKYPMTTIEAPAWQSACRRPDWANSEVGHTNMGAGRIVYQQLTLITKSIKDGEMLKNPVLVKNMKAAIDAGKAIHLMGLVGTGGVHSHADHWFGVLEMAKHLGAKNVYLHCITDGRDTDPHSGKGFLADLQAKLDELGIGKIASVSGRYYAMDRDNNWIVKRRHTLPLSTARAIMPPTLPRPSRHPMQTDKTDELRSALRHLVRAAACRMATL